MKLRTETSASVSCSLEMKSLSSFVSVLASQPASKRARAVMLLRPVVAYWSLGHRHSTLQTTVRPTLQADSAHVPQHGGVYGTTAAIRDTRAPSGD